MVSGIYVTNTTNKQINNAQTWMHSFARMFIVHNITINDTYVVNMLIRFIDNTVHYSVISNKSFIQEVQLANYIIRTYSHCV